MTRLGRVAVTLVVAVVLVGLTALAAHFLRPLEPYGPAEPERPGPVVIETPTGRAGPGGGLAEDEGESPSPAIEPVAVAKTDGRTKRPGPDTSAPAEVPSPTTTGGQSATGVAPVPAETAAATDEVLQALGMIEDRPVVAQKTLSRALKTGAVGRLDDPVRLAVRQLADRLQLSRTVQPGDPYSKRYTVQSGDNLTAIGQRYLIPYELVMRLNGLPSTAITAGQTLKVIQGPVHLEIVKSRYELRAWLDEVCLRVYPVAIGVNNSTPQGTFIVKNKIRNPPYQPQHKTRAEFRDAGAPDNPLGSRWIDLGNHYGIHGTIEPESIGHDVSEGCIRLLNKDVEELFDLVVVGASKVVIRP